MARDISKLPQWAQEKIINLEAQVRYYKAEVDNGTVGPEFPRPNLHLLSDRGIMDWQPSRYTSGRFMLGPRWDDFVDFKREESRSGPRVYVHAGLADLIVQPGASNAVYLSIKK